MTPPSVHSTSAWRREIVGSMTGMSLVGARPTTSGAPSRRSNDCDAVGGLISLKGIERNMISV